MGRYRKRPAEVEAFHYEGPSPEFDAWVAAHDPGPPGSGINLTHPERGTFDVDGVEQWPIRLLTVQGQWVTAREGEWIICEGVPGRFYPCAALVFDVTYEPSDGRAWGS